MNDYSFTEPTNILYAHADQGADVRDLVVFYAGKRDEVKDCVEVNVTEGWAIVYKHDEKGNPIIDQEKGEYVWEKIFGQFEIRRKMASLNE